MARTAAKNSVLVAVSALALILASPAHSAVAGDGGDGTSSSNGEVGGCDVKAPSSNEDACDDADSLPDRGEVIEAARAAAPQRYAGIWIERSVSPSVLRVAFVDAGREDQALLDKLSGGDERVTAVSAQFSETTLNATKVALSEALNATKLLVTIGVDAPSNSVLVGVKDAEQDQVLTAAKSAGLDSRMVSFTGYEDAEAAVSRTTFPPFAGGLALTIDPHDSSLNARLCTSGFTIKSSGDTLMGVTAGHCGTGHLDDDVYVGSDYLSRSGMNTFADHLFDHSDAMRFTLTPQSSARSKIFINGDTIDYRTVTAPRYTTDDLVVGEHLCFQGVTSDNNNCGDINRTDYEQRIAAQGPEGTIYFMITNAWKMNYPCKSGDSGGSVYHVRSDETARAAGVLSACVSGDTVFSAIGWVLSDMDATMYYGS